jgi:hypothetical protein
MKKTILVLLLMSVSYLWTAAQTATNFSCNDCAGNSHDFFSELDAGKVIVLCWVMPCGSCTGPALTTNNVVQSYQSSYPNTVYMYLIDDYANTSCASLNSWKNSVGITNATTFSNASINMLDYGSGGMPKIVVVGGGSHTVFYNVNNTVNATNLQNAINSALIVAGIEEPNAAASSFNAYPNPAHSVAEIRFQLANTSIVTLELFNLEGQKLETIFSGKLTQGENKVKLNVASYAAGMYLVRLTENEKSRFINVTVSR